MNHNKKWLATALGGFLGLVISGNSMADINTLTQDNTTYIADSSVAFPEADGFNINEVCTHGVDPADDVIDQYSTGYATTLGADVVDMTGCLQPINCTAKADLKEGSLLIPCLEVEIEDKPFECDVEMGQRGNSMNWKVEFVNCVELMDGTDVEENESSKGNGNGNGHGHNK